MWVYIILVWVVWLQLDYEIRNISGAKSVINGVVKRLWTARINEIYVMSIGKKI